MIDIHAHLCFPEFDTDREEVVAEARKRMTAVIASSARYEEGLKVMELAEQHKGFVYASLGYHPSEGDAPEKILELVEKSRDKIVAVGEVGLDFHWVKEPEKRELQKVWFLKFIELAGRIGKPLVIHSWDAEQECFELVKGSGLDCVFHCFSGKKELAQEIIDHGFYISVSTNVLFSKTTRKVAKVIPLEKMLLETDAPFLDPERKRNVPWNIELSAGKIAELRGIEKEEIIKKTTANAKRVFSL
jgi:TatD DNase family protein